MTRPRLRSDAKSYLGRARTRLASACEAYWAETDSQFQLDRINRVVRCALLVRRYEKKPEPKARPRFASPAMEAAYWAAVSACRIEDAEVTGKLRTQRSIAFRWAWASVATEDGYSLPQVARSVCRLGHSTFSEAMVKFWMDEGKNARHARALRGKIVTALATQGERRTA